MRNFNEIFIELDHVKRAAKYSSYAEELMKQWTSQAEAA
jgi:hypothetical protein